MNLGRGLLRLAIAITGVWFVFWTYAYILNPTEGHSPDGSSNLVSRFSEWQIVIPCLIVAVILGIWAVAGFRSRSSH
jgi:hypothetical protein